MSLLDVYIGTLHDPYFYWDGNPHPGNVPKRISPFFPPRAPFKELVEKIEGGELDGQKTDWGAWAARMSKEEILSFTQEYYRDYEKASPAQAKEYVELMDFIDGLEPGMYYALVAFEL